jgi:hypothetical protein
MHIGIFVQRFLMEKIMRTPYELLEFATTNIAYRQARGNLQYRAVDALLFVRDPGVAADMEQFTCRHSRAYTGIAYGGEDSGYHGEGRCYCCYCGLDGDA